MAEEYQGGMLREVWDTVDAIVPPASKAGGQDLLTYLDGLDHDTLRNMALSALVGPLIGVERNSKAIGIDLLKSVAAKITVHGSASK